MKKNIALPSLLIISALLGACSSMPTSTTLLEQTRSDYRMAQGTPNVISYAPMEMKQAGDALALANTAADKNESLTTIDQLAYVAKQKVALAQEVGNRKAAEAAIASSSKERDQVRLDQRTLEANQARQSAEQAKQVAEVALARNAQLEAQLANLHAQKTERGMVITLSDVLFGTDLSYLTADGMRTVKTLADVLQQNPQRMVLIEGFTDSTGGAVHNQDLSERRALSVGNALNEKGIPRGRIGVKGYGEDYPVAANDTAQNRQLNRRVEIVL
ncbi:MAG TPA: OmpA family protein, partial [Rhodocyclaceae bacterium]|nr:OmpA family protein [Rhodocyclaceae bacterium]